MNKNLLAKECLKLNPSEEAMMAEEGMSQIRSNLPLMKRLKRGHIEAKKIRKKK